jgi:hypothetical protein
VLGDSHGLVRFRLEVGRAVPVAEEEILILRSVGALEGPEALEEVDHLLVAAEESPYNPAAYKHLGPEDIAHSPRLMLRRQEWMDTEAYKHRRMP